MGLQGGIRSRKLRRGCQVLVVDVLWQVVYMEELNIRPILLRKIKYIVFVILSIRCQYISVCLNRFVFSFLVISTYPRT